MIVESQVRILNAMRQATKIWLVIAGTVLLCIVWALVNALMYVDIYPGAHPTQVQLRGQQAYSLVRQIIFLSGIAVVIFVGIRSAIWVAKRHSVSRSN